MSPTQSDRHWVNGYAKAASQLPGRPSRDTVRRMVERGEIYAERISPRIIRIDLNSFHPHPVVLQVDDACTDI